MFVVKMNVRFLLIVILVYSINKCVFAKAAIENGLLFYKNERQNDGSYSFGYETIDGTMREETGTIVRLKQANLDEPDEIILRVVGSYSYRGPDGKIYRTTYTADDLGYKNRNSMQAQEENVRLFEVKNVHKVSSVVLASLAGGGLG